MQFLEDRCQGAVLIYLLMQVEFLGRMQKQEQDDAWYTCINYISVCGMPVYGFIPAQLHLDWPDISASLDKPRGLLLRKVGASGITQAKPYSPSIYDQGGYIFFGRRCKLSVPLGLNACTLSLMNVDPFYHSGEMSA